MSAMRSFKGLPYAAPPVGSARWAAPQPPISWTTIRDASAFGSHCPQPGNAAGTSEDCLYLNVYTPVNGQGLPVMVWLHGGALMIGESDEFDPTQLVSEGAVVVTVNYRLGALGFLTHPALGKESAHGASGNYGLMDQQAALKWVQKNIQAFGGNPGNVTLFGQSAGGQSIMAHMASPLSKGLFHKAIVQSGAFAVGAESSLELANARGQTFAVSAGCADESAACLRALPVERVLEFQNQLKGESLLTPLMPTVDGKVLTTTTLAALTSGNYNKVPVIQGSTSHEFSLISALIVDSVLGRPIDAREYPDFIARNFGQTVAPAVLAEYPMSSSASPAWTADRAISDRLFACGNIGASRLLAAEGAPVYSYEFDDPNAPMIFDTPPRPDGFGSYHGAELQYVFPKDWHLYYGQPLTATQKQLSAQMIRYWVQFALTGDPNGSSNPVWPRYTGQDAVVLSLHPGAITQNRDFVAQHNCTFWQRHQQ